MFRNKNIILLSLFALIASLPFLFILSLSAEAQGVPPLVPCATNYTSGGFCRLCHLIVLIKNLVDYAFLILVATSLAMIMISGVLYIVSVGNAQLVEKAKEFFKWILIGFAVVLLAWLIVNYTLYVFARKTDLGITREEGVSGWNLFNIDCKERPSPDAPNEDNGGTAGTGTGTGGTGTGGTGTGGAGNLDPANCNNPQQMAEDAGVPYPAQRSASLQTLINCISGRTGQAVPGEGGSNNYYGSVFTYDHSRYICNFTRGQRTCGACSHSVNSCHYGGTTGSEGAMAVDFGLGAGSSHDPFILADIVAAARACGGRTLVESTHLHVSTGDCPR